MDSPGRQAWLSHIAEGNRAYKQGEHAQASAHFEAVVTEMKESGEETLELADCLDGLARVRMAANEHGQARSFYEASLKIRERLLGMENPELAGPLKEIALFYHIQLDLDNAEQMYQRLLAMREYECPEGNIGVADVLIDLAEVYTDQGRIHDAMAILDRAVRIKLRELGEDNAGLAQDYSDLADLAVAASNYQAAEHYEKKAFQIFRNSLGPNHPKTLRCMKRTLSLQDEKRRREELGKMDVQWSG